MSLKDLTCLTDVNVAASASPHQSISSFVPRRQYLAFFEINPSCFACLVTYPGLKHFLRNTQFSKDPSMIQSPLRARPDRPFNIPLVLDLFC